MQHQQMGSRTPFLDQGGHFIRCPGNFILRAPQEDQPRSFTLRHIVQLRGKNILILLIGKAQAVKELHPGRVVLGSDTAVVLSERILGKPADQAEGVAMLLSLSGQTHRVLTGVALISDSVRYALSESCVRFRAITEDEALQYWASGEPCDKAGGYAIQGYGAVFVERIEGSYSGIMGLPLFETAELLKAAHVRPGVFAIP